MGLAGALGLLLVVSLAVAVVSSRRIEGSLPGRSPILGLSVSESGFLSGTSSGLLSSSDGRNWAVVEDFDRESLVAGSGDGVVVLSGGTLYRSADLESFVAAPGELGRASALGVAPGGRIYVAREGRGLLVIDGDGSQTTISLNGGPPEVLALAVDEGETPVILAGGLSSGLWRSGDGGESWMRILQTPIRAVLIDRKRPGRVLIGTAGGVLASTQTDPWEFTDLRVPVEALAETSEGYFAITADRLLYESEDGAAWEASVLRDSEGEE